MSPERRKNWLPLGVLAAALLLWAGMFATGAYLQLGADAPRHDIRKPLIIMSSMAVFLSLWGLALWARAGGKISEKQPSKLWETSPTSMRLVE